MANPCFCCSCLNIKVQLQSLSHWGFLVNFGTTPTVFVSATTRRDGLVGRNWLDPGHFFLQAWLLIWWKRKRFVCETLKPRSGASNWYQICRLLRLVLKVFGSGKAVKLFAAFYCSFCRSLSPTVAFIVAYDENLKQYDCCLWTKGREGKTSRGLKLFSRF